MSTMAYHNEQPQPPQVDTIKLVDTTLNGGSISQYQKCLEFASRPDRLIIRFLNTENGGGKTTYGRGIFFMEGFGDTGAVTPYLHTWVCSEAEDEQDKLLVSVGKKRKDRERYLIHFEDMLEKEKFLSLLEYYGDSRCYKCIAPKLPTTEDELRKVEVDASWRPKARNPMALDPLMSINGSNPAIVARAASG